jgi:hypothetical protein
MLTPIVDVGEIALGNERHRDRMGLGFFLGDATHPQDVRKTSNFSYKASETPR